MQTRQDDSKPYERDLVLIGGGHTHALLLLRWAMAPLAGVRLTLISEHSQSPYSGMLPGLVAGHYDADDIHIDLRNLCRYAGARFIQSRVVSVDAQAKRIELEGRPPLDYDVASINVGATPDLSVAGSASHSTPVKPISEFWRRWNAVLPELLTSPRSQRIAVVGGGAGSVELAFAMAYRLRDTPVQHAIHLVTRGAELLPGYPAALQRWLSRRLQQMGIQVHVNFEVARVGADTIASQSGEALAFDQLFWCTQGRAAEWLRQSGLRTHPQGFVLVHPTLQTLTQPDLFAAGDCAWIDQQPLPRAGVYAVREAPILFENLKRHLQAQPLKPYRPQRQFLSLLACGGQDAVGARGAIAMAGAWVWHWKDRIDRRFMAMFKSLPVLPPPQQSESHSLEPPAMRCGGCGAKVGANVLKQALATLTPEHGAGIVCGLQEPDDAAIVTVPQGAAETPALVQSVDALKPLLDDPYLFARITALHALSDLFAMHARPHSAQLLAQIPVMAEALQVRDLGQMLAGVKYELERHGASLLGGHTLEAEAAQIGLTVNGFAPLQQLVRKGGAQPGDRLILTKPLGTGALFAAAMRGAAHASWIDAAVTSMLQSNAQAAEIFFLHGAHALTDITGFGLLGHLQEMLGPTALGAVIELHQIIPLPGALDCIERGYLSTLSPANRRSRHGLELDANVDRDPRYPLLFDPQTSGGLLAALPAETAPSALAALTAAGIPASTIGRCEPGPVRIQM